MGGHRGRWAAYSLPKHIPEGLTFVGAIHSEIGSVYGDDVSDADAVGQPNQGCIGQIHGAVCVFAPLPIFMYKQK